MKILLADDDAGIIDALTMMLELTEHEVISTLDGNKVIPLLRCQPNLIILDTWMSGVDGRDLCRAIKSNPVTKAIPVLMISATHEIKESALQSGANEFMAKPFEMNDFLERIKTMTYLDGTPAGS